MATKSIAWGTGGGFITLVYTGQGNGTISVTSDENFGDARQQDITIKTVKGNASKKVTIKQEAIPLNFKTADGMFIKTSDNKYFNVK